MRSGSERFFRAGLLLTAVSFVIMVLLFQGCGGDDNPVDNGTITVAPMELKFNTVRLGQFKLWTITIESTKNSNYDIDLSFEGTGKDAFSIDGPSSVTVPKNNSLLVKVKFMPTEAKEYTATLKVGTEATILLSGTGSDDALISYDPEELEFGYIRSDVQRTMNLNLNNISEDVLDLKIYVQGDDAGNFSISNNSIQIEAGAQVVIPVNFAGSEEKEYTALLKIDSLALVTMHAVVSNEVSLTVSPEELLFGNVTVGESPELDIVFRNNSQTSLQIAPVITGADAAAFSITRTPGAELEAGKFDTIAIDFSPTEIKAYNATLKLDADGQVIVPLSGVGIPIEDLQLSDDELKFGPVEIGNTKELATSIKNIFNSSITLTYVIEGDNKNDFSFVDPPVETLASDASANIGVRFTPNASDQTYSANIKITTSNGSEYNIALSGSFAESTILDLEAAWASSAPTIDGDDSDWGSATELNFVLHQVQSAAEDNRTFSATLKSMYDDEYIYFLAIVEDDTQDDTPNKLTFKGGDPADDANWTIGDNGQDGMSFIFPITDDVTGHKGGLFANVGCYGACHTAKFITTYESGMYPKTGKIDIVYWKAGTTNPQGHADDQYASGPEQARGGDKVGKAFEEVNFRDVEIGGNLLPISMAGGDNGGLDITKYIWNDTAIPFDPEANNPATGQAWSAGDEIAGWKLRIPEDFFEEGFRGDVVSKGKYKNGAWYVEFKRKLNTGSDMSNKDDIVFDTSKDLKFSFAYFENARKWADFEYINLDANPKPGHFGAKNYVITLKFAK